MEQLVHGASKQQAVTGTAPATVPVTTPAQSGINETRSAAAPASGEQPITNTESMNQLSTAPPGTGPPPILSESSGDNTNTCEPTQTNGKHFKITTIF